MKKTKHLLDVDSIGGIRSLTPEDEKAISEFLANRKVQKKVIKKRITKVT
ncbi:MAG: hypothetical protein ACK476_11670 [Fluviicola sp.]|jgi:hypothetical protein